MDKFLGMFKSEKSKITYSVWWDPEEKTVWRDTIFESREMIGYSATTKHSAINAAREYLATQI
jgi:hypothetical protein